jgi:CBS domain containing-hemolysin-like protein
VLGAVPGLLVLAVLFVALAAVSAAAEAALSRVSRARAAELLTQGARGAKALARVAEDPAPVLSVATLLRVVGEAGATATLTLAMVRLLGVDGTAALVAGSVMAAASFVAVGVGPRTFGRQRSEPIALVAAPVIGVLSRVLGPVTRLLVAVGNLLTPGKGMRDGPFASEAELRELVDMAQATDLIEAGERRMIHSVIDLGDTLAREVMVPRTDVVSVERGTALHDAMSLFLRSGYSRVPVSGDSQDDLLGILYLKDVARRLHDRPEAAAEQRVEGLMRPAVFVPDSKPVDALLREMQHAGHAAIVVDEYGGTAGLVTIEDIIEEIVGEIADEYDLDEPEVEDLGSGTHRVSARLHLDELGELFGTEIDDEEVDTVGGLLAKALGAVPIAGSQARAHGLVLTAERVEGRRHRLATVLVRRDPSMPPEGAP